MVVRDRFRAGRSQHGGTHGKLVEDSLHFDEKLFGHLPGKAVADKNALDHEIFAVRRHGISRNQPAFFAQAVGILVEGEA